jgi:hypothetical protein
MLAADASARSPAGVQWSSRRPVAVRQPRRPSTSPPSPAFGGQRIDRRCAGARTRRLTLVECPRRSAAPRPYDALAEQPRQPAAVVVSRAAGHRLEPRDRTSAIDDEHRRAGFEAVDQGAQAGVTSGMHVGRGVLPRPDARTIARVVTPACGRTRTACCRRDRAGRPDTSESGRRDELPAGPRSSCRRSRLPPCARHRPVPYLPS